MKSPEMPRALLLALLLADNVSLGAAQAFFGAGMTDVPGAHGAQVKVIAPGSPAERAGVRVGDVIVVVAAQPMADSSAVVSAFAAHAPGEQVPLTVLRDGRTLQLRAVMATGNAQAMAGNEPTPARAPAATVPPSVAPLMVGAYTGFIDPSEHAFTIDAPTGWAVTGSLTRRAALEISPFVRALSPDKMTYLMVGEPTLLTYTPPNATTARLGWREGSLHNAQLGGVTMLLRYLTGAQFAKLYGQSALAGLCPQMRFEGVQERSDFAEAADKMIPTVIPSVSTGGEASFSCRHGGNDMAVRVDAVTRADRNNIMWNVVFLRAFMTPNSQADAAQEILKHMTLSFRYAPGWVQGQNEISRRSAQAIQLQVEQAERAEQGVIQKLNETDESFTNMDDIVSGYSTYRDDQTGQTYKLSNTDPGKWVGDGGRILSTPDNTPPPWTPNARALTRVD